VKISSVIFSISLYSSCMLNDLFWRKKKNIFVLCEKEGEPTPAIFIWYFFSCYFTAVAAESLFRFIIRFVCFLGISHKRKSHTVTISFKYLFIFFKRCLRTSAVLKTCRKKFISCHLLFLAKMRRFIGKHYHKMEPASRILINKNW
jgi:hypothetical protein